MTGFVYLATNHMMPGFVKIGMTEGEVQDRMKALSRPTGVVGRYVFKCFCQVENAREIENQMHKAFEDKRVDGERETFKMDWLVAAGFLLVLTMAERNREKDSDSFHIPTGRNDNTENQIPNSDISLPTNTAPQISVSFAQKQQQKYVEYLADKGKTKQRQRKCVKYLKHLSDNHIGGSVYDITCVEKADKIYSRLLKNGDLHEASKRYKSRGMSAAMGHYVEFLRQNRR